MSTNINGVSGSRIAYYAAKEIEKSKKTLIIVSKEGVAERLRDDISFFVNKKICVVPKEEDFHILYEARDTSYLVQKIRAIDAMVSDEDSVIIAPISSILKKLPSSTRFLDSIIEIMVGDRISLASLKKRLVNSGYVAAPIIDGQGEFSVRGGIIDIFSPNYDDPLRIEFFDDEIDSMRFFDVESQLSLENINSIRICPAIDFMPTEQERQTALKKNNI